MKRAAFLLLLCSCGGGGGGSGSATFAGVWRGQLTVVENSCNIVIEPDSQTLTVNQDDDRIVIESDTGRTYEGVVTGDDSFSATRQEQFECFESSGEVAPGSFSLFVRTFAFSGVEGDSAIVTFEDVEGNCTGNNTVNSNACSYKLSGAFRRD